jgi:hypothetical protein
MEPQERRLHYMKRGQREPALRAVSMKLNEKRIIYVNMYRYVNIKYDNKIRGVGLEKFDS